MPDTSGRTLRGRSTNCQESSTDGSRKSERKRKDAMRNALQKHAHRGFGTIGEREPRSERATATAGTPQRRSTDRRESNAKAVARTKGRKASPCTLSGTRSAAFAIRKTHDLGHGYGKSFPRTGRERNAGRMRRREEDRGACGGDGRTKARTGSAGSSARTRTDNPTSPKCHGRRVMPNRMCCRRLARSGTSRCRCPRR